VTGDGVRDREGEMKSREGEVGGGRAMENYEGWALGRIRCVTRGESVTVRAVVGKGGGKWVEASKKMGGGGKG